MHSAGRHRRTRRAGRGQAVSDTPESRVDDDAAADDPGGSGDSGASDPDQRLPIGDVFRVREARYLYAAYALSLIGDQLAKVALAVLVYTRTGSPALTAVTYAISYVPWIVGGPILASYADRLPRRTVLITSDCIRAGAVALMTIPGLPLWLLLAVLFAGSLLAPPFESARSATWPEILEGELYVVGNAVVTTTFGFGQMLGFALGGTLVAAVTPRGALGIDAATFLASALCVAAGVRRRPAPGDPDRRASLLSETRQGLALVFGSKKLRSIVLLVWVAAGSCYGWEGVVAPWGDELGGATASSVGLLLASAAVGTLVGSLLLGRVLRPATRNAVMMPFALLAPAALLTTIAVDSVSAALLPLAATGLFMSFNIPLNGIFVRAVPSEFRGRAFGVAQSGLQAAQGVGVLVVGAVSTVVAPSTAIAASGVVGIVLIALITVRHPLRHVER